MVEQKHFVVAGEDVEEEHFVVAGEDATFWADLCMSDMQGFRQTCCSRQW